MGASFRPGVGVKTVTVAKTVLLACKDHDFGEVPAHKAKAEAKKLAKEGGKVIYLRDPVTDKVLGSVQPPARKAPGKTARAAEAKPAAKAAPKAKKAAGAKPKAEGQAKGPRGMVVEILKLASRPNGVSPGELNKLTTWKGAPWKWLFSNPKGNGYYDRWGYSFAVLKTDDGVRYQVVKRG
jgi:hypothetical protein